MSAFKHLIFIVFMNNVNNVNTIFYKSIFYINREKNVPVYAIHARNKSFEILCLRVYTYKILKMANEKTLERKLTEKVKQAGGLAIKLNSMGFTGLPDRMILMPGAKVKFAEIKTTGKKPTPLQANIHERLRKLGFEVWVIDTDKLLSDFLNTVVC